MDFLYQVQGVLLSGDSVVLADVLCLQCTSDARGTKGASGTLGVQKLAELGERGASTHNFNFSMSAKRML